MAGICSQGRENTVRCKERKCQKCLDSMTCDAWTHTLQSGLYPRRQISKLLWEPRVSQLYEERLVEEGGYVSAGWRGLLTEETSTGSRKCRGLLLWGTCRQGLCSVLLGPAGLQECHKQGPFAIQGDLTQEHWLILRHLGLEVQWKVSNLLLKWLFQIILISFLFPFVLSLYDLNQFWFYL